MKEKMKRIEEYTKAMRATRQTLGAKPRFRE